MARVSREADAQRALILLSGTFVTVAVVCALYWARSVFIPLALAVFLTFVLSPFVLLLQRRGLWRIPAALVVVVAAALIFGGLSWAVTLQITRLGGELPKHTENLKAKVESIRDLTGSGGGLGKMIDDLWAAFQGKPATHEPAGPDARPTPVTVQPDTPPWLTHVPSFLSPVIEFLGQGALAIVLVIFMLLKREDLRNRFIRLVGSGRMTVTTKAVDDAAQRVSRFLLAQAIINGSYGVVLAVGLAVIGVPYAVLWGFLAAVLRYIPYIGAWIAAIFPVALSVAAAPGWAQPLYVIGLVLVLELLSNNWMEPWLYGQSMGISEVAQLLSAAFWAFLWGPIGMVLSGPMTVCLLVLGKYVPHLDFLEVILGDEPPLAKDMSYYQRLTARDHDEATELVLEHLKEVPPEQVYDALLLPALNYTKRDRAREGLTAEDERFILQATREILEDVGEQKQEEEPAAGASAGGAPRVRVIACPARDEADEVALEMFRQLLNPEQWDVRVLGIETLASELISSVGEAEPAAVCLGALPPGGLAHTRYLCKRLRAHFPELKIVVGRWGLKSRVEENREELKEAGADSMETSLLSTVRDLQALLSVLTQQQVPGHEPARAELATSTN